MNTSKSLMHPDRIITGRIINSHIIETTFSTKPTYTGTVNNDQMSSASVRVCFPPHCRESPGPSGVLQRTGRHRHPIHPHLSLMWPNGASSKGLFVVRAATRFPQVEPRKRCIIRFPLTIVCPRTNRNVINKRDSKIDVPIESTSE